MGLTEAQIRSRYYTFIRYQIVIINCRMHSSPETSELIQIFKELDQLKVGYLTLDQFAAYIQKQPRKIEYYLLNDLFNHLPDARMTEQAFICYVMGYRMNLEQLALARFALQKQFSKHAAASPSSGANEIKKSGLKFSVASKKNLSAGQKHRVGISLGRDEKAQSKVYEQIEQILGEKPDDILGIIKFKVNGAHEQIRHDLEQVIEMAKGMLTEMDEELFRILDLFKFSVKGCGNYIYIIVQVGHVFLIDTVNFINEFVQTLSPDSLIELSAQLQSNYFKDFLKEGAEKKMEDLEFQIGLNIDNESLKKVKKIVGSQAQFGNPQQEIVGILMLLLQQVNIEASFSNSQKLFNQVGVGSVLSQSKSSLGALKDMQILQTVEGFVPENMIENIKKHGVGEGEISIHFKSIYLRIDFNVEIAGIFDLL